MENVVLSIVPVRETCLVTRCLHDWLLWSDDFLVLWQVSLTLLALVINFVSCGEVHLVRVNDLGLFFQVECLFVVLYLCLGKFAIVILPVV